MDILEFLNDSNKKISNANTQDEKLNALEPLAMITKKFINELKQCSTDTETLLCLIDEKKHSDVIKPNECIMGGELSLARFYLDDLEVYNDFSKYLIKRFLLKEHEMITFDDLILATQLFIIRTFGPSGDEKDLYHFFCRREDEHVSIKDIYKKNWAVCIERATFVHNLLKMLELDDTVIYCNLTFNNKKEVAESHALNVVRHNDEYYIIDFTNYSSEYNDIVVDDKTLMEIKNVIPTVVKLSQKEYEDFINGQNIEFDIVDRNLNGNTEKIKHCVLESCVKQDEKKRNM